MRTALLLPGMFAAWGLVACDSERLSAHEARDTFEAINAVTNEVVWSARESIEQGTRASLEVEGDGEQLELDGVVRGDAWKGRVTVDGEVTEQGERFVYELVVAYDQVTVNDGPTVDGELVATFYIDLGTAAELGWSLGISLDGELAVTGASTGLAEVAYDLELRIDGFSIAFEAQGTISGYDVSDWGYAFSL
jgi:hypothetical protein